ncbi:MAG: hypothetical protein HYT88_07405, partial [Candidatus Omnitrophica bacterium]|nr:hypothetical protein [Candidatus Omnitrophota bacterium]
MDASDAFFLLVIVISLCLVVLTITVVWLAMALRGTLERLNVVLPALLQTAEEARRVFQQARRFWNRANSASEKVETFVQDTYEATCNAFERFGRLRDKAK